MSIVDPQDTTAVADIRAALPDVQAIYRFGSSATGTSGPESDIDLAVLAPRPLDTTARCDLQERLAAALRRSVDLIDLRSVSTVMAMQVVSGGLLLHEGDAVARGAFEDRCYSGYARLNEERRGILERVAAEGSVYGG
ncbi:MAG: nucleotidyltransferase domain-containing protein [Vicinamibacterales bacterium]|nr:nucleotidyltransferase domain-containing protein [Vicinamibacterales bacterium]